ncbi:MAG TPA: AI-2E family transporter [Patescibacteria group bacterium]|nr:AI-2E family transporter [Patescibacteria group bacterium]
MFGFRKSKTATVDLNIPTRVVVRVVALVILAFIALAALKQAQHAVVLIFTSFFLALALNGPVHWIAQRMPGKRRGSRAAGTAISFLVVILLLAGFLLSVVPPLVRQTTTFISNAPQLIEQAQSSDSTVGRYITKYHLQDQVSKVSTQVKDRLGDIGGTAVTSVTKFASSVFTVLTILVLTFMMLIEGPRWIRFFRDLIPDEHHDRADRLARDMYHVVKGYVNGQVVLAVIAACMLLPGLLLLHISYPAALIVVVFVCGLIPLVGHTIGAVIVTTVALFHSPWSAIIILGYYILYQQIENYIIQPRIQANSTNMSPLLVFASVIIGVSFGGLFGGLVAIPLMGCIRIALLDYLRSRRIIEESTFENATGHEKPGEVGAKS